MNRRFLGRSTGGLLLAGLGLAAKPARAAGTTTTHGIAVQVSTDDPAVMNLALSNVANAAEHYAKAGEPVSIELVAYGPGFTMLRADASPVQARIAELRRRLPAVVFSACQNSRRAIAQAEGKSVEAIPEVPGTTDVPSGIVRLSELQEQGWSYIRP